MDPNAAGAQVLGVAEPLRGPPLPNAREGPLRPGVCAPGLGRPPPAAGPGSWGLAVRAGRGPRSLGSVSAPLRDIRQPSAVWARARAGNGRAAGLQGGTCEGVGGRAGWEARGAQSIPNDIPLHGEDAHCEEGSSSLDDDDSDGEPSTWELPDGVSGGLPKEERADLFHEDWDLELKADQGNPYDADDVQGSLSQEIKPWVCCPPQGDMVYDPSWHHPPPLIPHYSKMVFETGQFDDAED
ncbi:coordinator of PRMT5 and differentiation stimulator [Rhynchocyon petersi]